MPDDVLTAENLDFIETRLKRDYEHAQSLAEAFNICYTDCANLLRHVRRIELELAGYRSRDDGYMKRALEAQKG